MRYEDLVVADRPRAYWPLGDTASPVRDLSGHGYDGTVGGSGGSYQAAGLIGGKAMAFATDRSVAWPVGARQTVQTYSRECWLRTTSATDQFLVAQYGATNGEDYWILRANGNWRIFMYSFGFIFDYDNFGGGGGNPGGDFRDGRVHHLVYTRTNAGQARLWGDAQLLIDQAGGTSAQTLSASAAGYVGRAVPDTAMPVTGTMQHVAIYDYALSADQVRRHYQVGRGLAVAGTRRRR